MLNDFVWQKILQEQFRDSARFENRIVFHERFSINPYGWHRWVFDQFSIPPHAKILELGCGVGRLWALNAKRVDPSWQINLTDSSRGMIDKASTNTKEINASFSYELVDATEATLGDDEFDAIIANHFMYFIVDRKKRAGVLSAIRRALKINGKFYATTNGASHMREIEALIKEFDESFSLVADIVQHFSIESGSSEVSNWFGKVETRHYDDALIVDNVEMLIEFILSSITMNKVTASKKEKLRRFIENKLSGNDAQIRVHKNMGMIVASA